MPGWTLPPHEQTTTVSIRIPKSLRERLVAVARVRHRTLTEVCIFLLDAGLAELGEVGATGEHEHSRSPKKK